MLDEKKITKRFTSLVYLSQEPILEFSLPREQLKKYLRAVDINTEDGVIKFSSMQDQIMVEVKPARVRIVDKSEELPYRKDFPTKVVQVIGLIAKENKLIFTGLGINFDIEFKAIGKKSAQEVIATQFINERKFSELGYDVIGGSVRIEFKEGKRESEFDIRPVQNENGAMDFRIHFTVKYMQPEIKYDAQWIEKILTTEYKKLKSIVVKTLVK